jgi:hypothetical protein
VLSLITRGARFYMLAALLYFWGEPARQFIERRLGLVWFASVVIIVGGFYLSTKLF